MGSSSYVFSSSMGSSSYMISSSVASGSSFGSLSGSCGDDSQLECEGVCGCKVFREQAGFVSDGSGESNYAHDSFCEWMISVPNASSIELVFSFLDTEEGYDFVDIFQCESECCENATLLDSLSGSLFDVAVISSTGIMKIALRSDSVVSLRGFAASWRVLCSGMCDCGIFDGDTGVITDGSGDLQYAGDSRCEWIIAPPLASVIRLSFSFFELLPGDEVQVWECSDGVECFSKNLLESFSGSQSGESVVSSTGIMVLGFQTQSFSQGQGFEAEWAVACNGFCTCGVFEEDAGSLTDGSGPLADYMDMSRCEWMIAPPGASAIRLEFGFFETHQGDFVRVLECDDEFCSSSVILANIRGLQTGSEYVSRTGFMKVEFSSDGDTGGPGFEADWSVICNNYCACGTFRDQTGTISDGSGQLDVMDKSRCEWIIAPPRALSIELTFPFFETVGGDYVLVLECTDETCGSSTELAFLSGSQSGIRVTSGTGVVKLQLISDNDVQSPGFEANWQAFLPASGDCSCSWIQTNANSARQLDMGIAQSRDECIALVRSNCWWATIANFGGGDGAGSCYCQDGEERSVDESGRESCWLEEVPSSCDFCHCEWIRNNYNTEGELYVGDADSQQECIELVRRDCPWATIANFAGASGSGECWCQEGNDRTPDETSAYESCWIESVSEECSIGDCAWTAQGPAFAYTCSGSNPPVWHPGDGTCQCGPTYGATEPPFAIEGPEQRRTAQASSNRKLLQVEFQPLDRYARRAGMSSSGASSTVSSSSTYGSSTITSSFFSSLSSYGSSGGLYSSNIMSSIFMSSFMTFSFSGGLPLLPCDGCQNC
eukprot:1276652-Rhodomonas_salina.1